MKLRLLTLNIHKGYSVFNNRFVLNELRDALRASEADIVLLQEVRGTIGREDQNQWEILADEVWRDHAYGKNAKVDQNHHGNAILSKFPIADPRQYELPSHRLEPRGYLEALIHIPEISHPIHILNVHLGLFNFHRRRQIEVLNQHSTPNNFRKESARIIAGDFNDWSKSGHRALTGQAWIEAHEDQHHCLAKTFPSFLPVLPLDRIYLQGAKVEKSMALRGLPWSKLSDHIPLYVEMDVL